VLQNGRHLIQTQQRQAVIENQMACCTNMAVNIIPHVNHSVILAVLPVTVAVMAEFILCSDEFERCFQVF